MNNYDDYIIISAWASDFVRAMQNKPRIIKLIFRIIMGRYAYREFIGLMDDMTRAGLFPYFDYSLENCKYHKDPVPLFNWWKQRLPFQKEKYESTS
jgi:hypothetical protein